MMAVAALPPLPSIIHYEDDYDEVERTLKISECHGAAYVHASGEVVFIQFTRFGDRVRLLVRHFLLMSLQNLAPSSVIYYYNLLLKISALDLEQVAALQPMQVKNIWGRLMVNYPGQIPGALKSFIGFLCRVNFLHWTPLHADFVSFALHVGRNDRYSVVRSGNCFIDAPDEARLVRWIDDAALKAQTMNRSQAEMACLVVCSYQFGMRPKQMGIIRKRDCSIRISQEDGSAIVHLTFKMIKQRDVQLSKLPLVRKVKREWAPLYVALLKAKSSDDADSFLFGFNSRAELSRALIDALAEIVPDARLTAYDLRHSMAQRLVDSGASQEELASALGHSTLCTSLVYFQASANQAELVNKALGASPIYQAVAKIAKEKFISPDELATLQGDMQIAGVPHGIPIAGIGGCSTGQPACPYNPVTACYGCPKFMPVSDLALHEQVLQEFRNVVLFFKDGGHGDMTSPAYLQLQRTIAEVQGVIQELKGGDDE